MGLTAADNVLKQANFMEIPGPVILLTGAGISAEGPSGIPIGNALCEYLLRQLLPGRDDVETVKAHFAALNYPGLLLPRLELVCEIALDRFGPPILQFLNSIFQRPPNRTHKLLAKMRGCIPIVTTNFDCCIEEACEWDIYRVVANQEAGLEAMPELFKLHGSADRDFKQLGITLNAIRQGYSPAIANLLDSFWRGGATFVVCGYSGQDASDLWPFVRWMAIMTKLSDQKYVKGFAPQFLWIQHSSEAPSLLADIPEDNLCFHLFRQSAGVGSLKVLSGPTYDFLHAIASRIDQVEYIEALSDQASSLPEVFPLQVSDDDKYRFRDDLFLNIGLSGAIVRAVLEDHSGYESHAGLRRTLYKHVFHMGLPDAGRALSDFGKKFPSCSALEEFAEIAGLFRLTGLKVGGWSTSDFWDQRAADASAAKELVLIDVHRARTDSTALEFLGETMLTRIENTFLVHSESNKDTARQTIKRIEMRWQEQKTLLLPSIVSVIAQVGPRLLASRSGLKFALAVKYLQESGLLDIESSEFIAETKQYQDDWRNTLSFLLSTTLDDIYWSAVSLNDFHSAFDTMRLILETYLVHVYRNPEDARVVDAIAKMHQGALRTLKLLSETIDSKRMRQQYVRLKLVFMGLFHYEPPGESSEMYAARYDGLETDYGKLEQALAQKLTLDISCY